MDPVRSIAVVYILLAGITFLYARGEETKYFSIETVIKNRFAETVISSEVLNDAKVSKELSFHVMLPKEAFITHFDMIINGTKYDGEIEEKQKAEKIFKEARERGRTAGIVRTEKQTNKVFKTSVNIAAGETVTFNLIYQQILRKTNGKFRNSIILLGGILDVSIVPEINVYICESKTIKSITVPEVVSSDEGTYEHDASIEYKGNWGHVEFFNIELNAEKEQDTLTDDQGSNFTSTSSQSYQPFGNVSENTRLSSGSFVVEYELEDIDKGGQILIEEGYLFHFFSPEMKKPSRRFVFVLDISFSMTGRKLRQMNDAIQNILGKFREEDKLGIIKFHDGFFTWANGALRYGTEENIKSAIKFLLHNHDNGGTYIWGALKEALNMLINDTENEETNPENNMVILLTDGLGFVRKEEMLRNVKSLGEKRFTIHTIGFGDGVDADLLKALAADNHGSWKQILETFDAHLQIESYFEELGISLLYGIEFQYPSIVEETQLHRDRYLFGSEVVAISKLKSDVDMTNSEPQNVKVKGRSGNVEITLDAQFQLNEAPNKCELSPQVQSVRDFGKKAFGMIKVEEALRLYDAESNSTIKEELKENAIKLSILHQLVTPVTSMLVVKPEDKAELEQAVEAEEIIDPTQPPPPVYSSGGGSTHRVAPGYYGYGDPHFVVKLSMDINVCFDWPWFGRRVVNLLYDRDNQIIINALMASSANSDGKVDKRHGIFIRQSSIILPAQDIEISINDERALVIDISDKNKQDDLLYLPLLTTATYNASYEGLRFSVKPKINYFVTLSIMIKNKISIVVDVRHQKPKFNTSRHHLDISLADSEGLSDNLSGLFGILHIPKEMQKVHVRIEERVIKEEKDEKKLLVFRDRKIPAKRQENIIPHVIGKVDCWKIEDVKKLLGVSLESFDQKSLFEIPK